MRRGTTAAASASTSREAFFVVFSCYSIRTILLKGILAYTPLLDSRYCEVMMKKKVIWKAKLMNKKLTTT